MKQKTLIFFDSHCSLCKRAVHYILSHDKKKKFQFAPLSGKTADLYLKRDLATFKNSNTLVLIESKPRGHITAKIRASAFLRILWLLGGVYKLSAVLYPFLFLLNLLYRVVAKYRRWLFPNKLKSFSEYEDRFLP